MNEMIREWFVSSQVCYIAAMRTVLVPHRGWAQSASGYLGAIKMKAVDGLHCYDIVQKPSAPGHQLIHKRCDE